MSDFESEKLLERIKKELFIEEYTRTNTGMKMILIYCCLITVSPYISD